MLAGHPACVFAVARNICLPVFDRPADRFSGGKRVINFMRASVAGLSDVSVQETGSAGRNGTDTSGAYQLRQPVQSERDNSAVIEAFRSAVL